MTVYVLMPVFNRLLMTQAMLSDLAAQQVDQPLEIWVIDDGSVDGTAAWLRTRADVRVLEGDGSLWWGGAIDLGIRTVLTRAKDSDWVLLVNNDAHITPDFLQKLLDTGCQHAPVAIGSVIRHAQTPHDLMSVGPLICPAKLRVSDAISQPSLARQAGAGIPVEVDALSGRGALFPVAALRTVRGMRPLWLPHYLADYELALRVKAAGWRLLVNPQAVTYSLPEYGNAFVGRSWLERFFSVRSPYYLPAQLRFWWVAGSTWQRLTLPFRMFAMSIYRAVRERE